MKQTNKPSHTTHPYKTNQLQNNLGILTKEPIRPISNTNASGTPCA